MKIKRCSVSTFHAASWYRLHNNGKYQDPESKRWCHPDYHYLVWTKLCSPKVICWSPAPNGTVFRDKFFKKVTKVKWSHRAGLWSNWTSIHRRGRDTRDLPLHMRPQRKGLVRSGKAAVCKPGRVVSPETNLLAPWPSKTCWPPRVLDTLQSADWVEPPSSRACLGAHYYDP